jgi:hypothetical protein
MTKATIDVTIKKMSGLAMVVLSQMLCFGCDDFLSDTGALVEILRERFFGLEERLQGLTTRPTTDDLLDSFDSKGAPCLGANGCHKIWRYALNSNEIHAIEQ